MIRILCDSFFFVALTFVIIYVDQLRLRQKLLTKILVDVGICLIVGIVLLYYVFPFAGLLQ